jgi:uncharacterized protein YutE (UPF0331/DUF86 family)
MRIDDKIEEIELYLAELVSIVPDNFRDYASDLKTKAACERYFEKIIESVVDLAFLLIREQGFKIPEEEKEAFDILASEKVIGQELAARLKDAKGMRNIIAHQYGNVDDEIVFQSITEELVKDVSDFIFAVKR